MDKSYNKFQLSYFLDNGAQIVVRGDDKEEFKADVLWAKTEYPVKTGVASQIADDLRANNKREAQDDQYCTAHSKVLKRRETPMGVVYDHRKLENEKWFKCYGDGKWKE